MKDLVDFKSSISCYKINTLIQQTPVISVLTMKIAIIGSRGIPAKYGGFETIAEELSKRLVKKDIK